MSRNKNNNRSGISSKQSKSSKAGASAKTNKSGRYGSHPASLNYSRISNEIKLTDYLAATPGILMVAMIVFVLILDLFTTTMAETQYYDFHNIFRVFDYTAIALGVILLIVKIVKHELHIELRDLFFAGFMVCIVISTCINGLSHEAAFGLPVRFVGVFNMLAFFIIYMQASGYIERVQFRYTILLAYIFSADAIALSVLYDRYVSIIEAYQNKEGISAVFVNSNHYGYFLAMAIMISIGLYIYEDDRRLIGIGIVSGLLNLGILALNMTMGAVLAVGICTLGMFVIILLKERDRLRRILILIAAFAAAVIGVLALSSSIRADVFRLLSDMAKIITGRSDGTEGSGRWVLWLTTIDYIKEKPLFGHGCEGITLRLQEACGIGDAHCEPMTFAAYYGIPGMILYLCGIISTAVSYFRHRAGLPSYCRVAFLAASAYFLSSLVGVPMFNTAPFFYVFIGMSSLLYTEPGLKIGKEIDKAKQPMR